MKSKFFKIMGIGLILVMALSLTISMALPAAAGENEWSSPAVPAKEGSSGDWLWSDNLTDGAGPLARAIDGTLYCYVGLGSGPDENHVLQSTDDGRTWSKTDYWKDLDDPDPVVDFAISRLDADTLYATDGSHVYYTKNAGDKWQTVGDASIPEETITSVDIAYDASDNPFVFIGTSTGGGGGSVWYISQSGYPAQWTDLELDLDVLAVAASPEFADSDEIFAVADNGTDTVAYSNLHGEVGGWSELATLYDDDGDSFVAASASRICFPDDFSDDNYEFFVGLSADKSNPDLAGGSVYRVDDGHAYCLGNEDSDIKDKDIISLDIIGSYGATSLMAGTFAGTEGKVIYSTDDGDSWDTASKDPSGDGKTFVVIDGDFDESGIAWAAGAGDDGAVSLTVDGGDLWNQISLVSTAIDEILDVSFSTNYAVDETRFLLTTGGGVDSLWRDDGTNWERVFTSSQFDTIDKVMVSINFPKDETVYVADSSGPTLYRSTDGGNDWGAISNNPGALTAWIVLDADTVLTGGDGVVWKTGNHGRRAWDDYDIDGGTVVSFSVSPNFTNDDTLLLGDDEGQVFISEERGEDWDMVGSALDATTNTIVAFDSDYDMNGFIYAAAGDEIARCEIDTAEDWGDQEWNEFTTAKTGLEMAAASGLACAHDGTLYATDATSANQSAAAGGAWRSLNPTDSMGDVVFEEMSTDFGLDDGAQLTGLRLTRGTNVLWALDDNAPTELWTYEDFLAAPVIKSSPPDSTGIDDTDKAWLSWEELNGADEYELKYTTDSHFRVSIVTISDLDDTEERIGDGVPDEDLALDDGTMYYWKVKVTEPLLSRWSTVWNFTTKLAPVDRTVEWMPENGAQDVIIRPSFGWTRVDSATSYELELADNPDFTNPIKATTTINSWKCDTDLSYSTTYYWRVQALKGSVVVSSWRSGAFTTMAEPAPPVEVTPAPPAPEITLPAPQVIMPEAATPGWVWAIIGIGAALVIAVIVLIIRTRRAL